MDLKYSVKYETASWFLTFREDVLSCSLEHSQYIDMGLDIDGDIWLIYVVRIHDNQHTISDEPQHNVTIGDQHNHNVNVTYWASVTCSRKSTLSTKLFISWDFLNVTQKPSKYEY